MLRHDGLLRSSKTRVLPVKILGGGDAPKGVTIHAHAFTRSALEKPQAAGSTAQRISWPDGAPIDEGAEAKEAAAAEAEAEAKAQQRAGRPRQSQAQRPRTATPTPRRPAEWPTNPHPARRRPGDPAAPEARSDEATNAGEDES